MVTPFRASFRGRRSPAAFRDGPFGSGGLAFDLVCDDAERGAALAGLLEPLRLPARSELLELVVSTRRRRRQRPILDARLDGELVIEAEYESLLFEDLLRSIDQWVMERTPENVHVHASAVVGDRGMVMFLGPSGAGKSTLVAAMCEAGGSYLTDELVGFTSDGQCCPLPLPLRLKPGSWSMYPDWPDIRSPSPGQPTAVRILGHRAGVRSFGRNVMPSIIVECARSDEPVGPELSPMTPGEVMAAMLRQSFDAVRHPDPLPVLARVAAGAAGFRASYSDARQLVALLPSATSPGGVPSVRWEPVATGSSHRGKGPAHAPGLESVLIGDQVVAFLRHRSLIVVLGGSVTDLWPLLDGTRSEAQLLEHLQRVSGMTSVRLRQTLVPVLAELVELGVLV